MWLRSRQWLSGMGEYAEEEVKGHCLMDSWPSSGSFFMVAWEWPSLNTLHLVLTQSEFWGLTRGSYYKRKEREWATLRFKGNYQTDAREQRLAFMFLWIFMFLVDFWPNSSKPSCGVLGVTSSGICFCSFNSQMVHPYRSWLCHIIKMIVTTSLVANR